MSDIMLLGILRMPFNTKGDIHLVQLQGRCLEAADRIEKEEVEKRVNEILELGFEYGILKDQNAALQARLRGKEKK